MAWQIGRRAAATAAAVAVVTAFLASCGGDDDSSSPEQDLDASSQEQDDASDDSGETTTTVSPEDEVIEAYKAARTAIYAAYDPPNPVHPDMVALVDGEALAESQYDIGILQGDGVSYVGPFEMHPTFVTQTGDEAIVDDCLTETTQTVRTDTREAVTAPEEFVYHHRIDMKRIDGVWKIVKVEELSETCTP